MFILAIGYAKELSNKDLTPNPSPKERGVEPHPLGRSLEGAYTYETIHDFCKVTKVHDNKNHVSSMRP